MKSRAKYINWSCWTCQKSVLFDPAPSSKVSNLFLMLWAVLRRRMKYGCTVHCTEWLQPYFEHAWITFWNWKPQSELCRTKYVFGCKVIVAIILAASHSQGKTIHCTRRFKDTLGWGGWGTKYSKCKYLTSNIIAILPKSRFIHSRTHFHHFSKLFILNWMIFCFTSCADAVVYLSWFIWLTTRRLYGGFENWENTQLPN